MVLMEQKKLLIVGGTGVISFAVAQEALKQGFDVTCINRGISNNQTLPPDISVIIADYRNRDHILSKLEGLSFDVVIDVLCYTEKDIEYSISIFKDKCSQYIFFSSCAVYNKGNGDYECTEDSKLINPIWQYSIDKVNCERKLIELAINNGIKYTIVRPAVTYGDTRIPYGITPPYGYHGTIIQRLLHHKPIILWDNGEAYSTITHVKDFSVGLVGLLGNPRAYNEVFHIVGDERYKWKEVIDQLADILGVKPEYFNLTKEQYAAELPSRKGELLGGRGISQLLNNKKIKETVPNFRTTITLKTGLSATVKYYQENNYIKGIDWQFDADTDRIIRKYSKNKQDYNIGFCDYLGTANLWDKIDYLLEFYKENFIIALIGKIKNKCRRLYTKFNRR